MTYNRMNDKSTLHIYDIEKKSIVNLVSFDYLIEAPNWTSDGKYLIYNSNGNMYSYKIATGENKIIDTGYVNNCNNDHVLSSDGKYIALSHGTKEDGKSRIYVCNLKGEPQPRLITALPESYLHGWSNDMKTLAYCANRGGNYSIYCIPSFGGEEILLTDSSSFDDGPEYSPCDKYIWFNSNRSGLMQAYRMNNDGTDVRQMTFDENRNTWFPHISPDGKQVVLLSYKKGDLESHQHEPHKNIELRLMSSEGGEVKTIVSLFGGQGTINVNSWSPCSKKFAYVSYERTDKK